MFVYSRSQASGDVIRLHVIFSAMVQQIVAYLKLVWRLDCDILCLVISSCKYGRLCSYYCMLCNFHVALLCCNKRTWQYCIVWRCGVLCGGVMYCVAVWCIALYGIVLDTTVLCWTCNIVDDSIYIMHESVVLCLTLIYYTGLCFIVLTSVELCWSLLYWSLLYCIGVFCNVL